MAQTYRLYLETDLNRVFSESLSSIAAAELEQIVTKRLGSAPTSIAVHDAGRTVSLQFVHDGDPVALADVIATLSASAVLFVEHSATALEPLHLADRLCFGTELVTAQRYKGKTNERLTRLLLNLASAADQSAVPEPTLIDPMCGRGTTLNWALLNGIPSTGIDLDRRALDDYATFLEQWAKRHRYPHRLVRHKKQHGEGRHLEFTVGVDRASLDAKNRPDIRTFHGPADADALPVGRASMIVADLPYSIQHRARRSPGADQGAGADREGGRPASDGPTRGRRRDRQMAARRPTQAPKRTARAVDSTPTSVGELVERVAARWTSWLRGGGAVALAWNIRSLDRTDLAAAFAQAGFEIVRAEGFVHPVDRLITRDVFLATMSNRPVAKG